MKVPLTCMNTQFHFRSTAFNCTVPREHYVDPGCYGDDVARWLIQELKKRSVETSASPDQEDYAWFFQFTLDGTDHCVVVGFQPNDPKAGDQWIGWIERRRGLLGSLFGGRSRGISPEAVAVLDDVLRSSPDIHDLSWHAADEP